MLTADARCCRWYSRPTMLCLCLTNMLLHVTARVGRLGFDDGHVLEDKWLGFVPVPHFCERRSGGSSDNEAPRRVRKVAVGAAHSIVLDTRGIVWGCGYNKNGVCFVCVVLSLAKRSPTCFVTKRCVSACIHRNSRRRTETLGRHGQRRSSTCLRGSLTMVSTTLCASSISFAEATTPSRWSSTRGSHAAVADDANSSASRLRRAASVRETCKRRKQSWTCSSCGARARTPKVRSLCNGGQLSSYVCKLWWHCASRAQDNLASNGREVPTALHVL